ncbi:MAG: TlpA family protein disulfide reductase, partial [Chloroflexi bacterium]|nr:TlpA family protein disulfide reductase [Chloroflexota bacterium]
MSLNTSTEQTQSIPSILKARWFWITLIGLIIVLGSAWIAFSRTLFDKLALGSEAGSLEPAPIVGHPAPDFALPTLDGEIVRLSDFKGKPVLLNFWATWCGPCRAEFPDFQKASVDNADTLVIIGINNTSTDQKDQVPAFVEEFGATFPIVLDETGETAKAYGILGLPTSIFIDRNGNISEIFTGPINKAYIEA